MAPVDPAPSPCSLRTRRRDIRPLAYSDIVHILSRTLLWIIYEAISLFFILAIALIMFGAWGVLSLVDWIAMFFIAIVVAGFVVVVRRPQVRVTMRRDVSLKILLSQLPY